MALTVGQLRAELEGAGDDMPVRIVMTTNLPAQPGRTLEVIGAEALGDGSEDASERFYILSGPFAGKLTDEGLEALGLE